MLKSNTVATIGYSIIGIGFILGLALGFLTVTDDISRFNFILTIVVWASAAVSGLIILIFSTIIAHLEKLNNMPSCVSPRGKIIK